MHALSCWLASSRYTDSTHLFSYGSIFSFIHTIPTLVFVMSTVKLTLYMVSITFAAAGPKFSITIPYTVSFPYNIDISSDYVTVERIERIKAPEGI